jgi:hypothetical protein
MVLGNGAAAIFADIYPAAIKPKAVKTKTKLT